MKNSILFLLILVIAVLGGLGLFYAQSNLPDNDLINRDVSNQLLKIDNLDSSVNELVLRSRANLDSNYDMLVRSTSALERTVSDLSNGHFSQENIEGSLLDVRYNSFLSSIEVKIDQVEDFKSSNSVLRNSEKYAPLVGAELANIANQNGLSDIADFYTGVVIDILDFTKQGSTKAKQDVQNYAQQIRETEAQMPEANAIKVLEFANHVQTAIDSKELADQYLGKALNTAVDDQIVEISDAWGLKQAEENSSEDDLRTYTLAYVGGLLGLLGILVFRLRSLYTNLDQQVEAKTQEVKQAYEEIRESEDKLSQNEKMASLGQLVAGVAHEINTPLSYISSNVDTIKGKLNELSPILGTVDSISKTVADPNREKDALNSLLKEQVVAYRKVENQNIHENVNVLLEDATDGIGEIKQIVTALTNFSHSENEPTQEVDINERLQKAIKVSASFIGERSVVTEFSEDSVLVNGVPNQLTQVFTNIINNASHATDSVAGVITIQSEVEDGSAVIKFKDNGHGIHEQDLKRVFEPFFTTKEVGEGTGLGLSIAHSIVEAHEGKLSIDSSTKSGTTIIVSLPILTAKE